MQAARSDVPQFLVPRVDGGGGEGGPMQVAKSDFPQFLVPRVDCGGGAVSDEDLEREVEKQKSQKNKKGKTRGAEALQ